MTEEQNNLPAEPGSVESIGTRHGMFGVSGSGDTSGYGGLVKQTILPAPAERRSPPESAGRGAFGNIMGEPTTDHAARYYKFESGLLQRRVHREPGFRDRTRALTSRSAPE